MPERGRLLKLMPRSRVADIVDVLDVDDALIGVDAVDVAVVVIGRRRRVVHEARRHSGQRVGDALATPHVVYAMVV